MINESKILLSKDKQASIGFRYAAQLPLIMIKGVGWQTVTSKDYIWNGRKRSDDHYIFQYTLSGKGEIEIENDLFTLQAGDGFLIEVPGENCYRLPDSSSEWEFIYIEFSKESEALWRHIMNLTEPIFHLSAEVEFISTFWRTYSAVINDEVSDIYQNSKYAYELLMEIISYFTKSKNQKLLPTKIELCKEFIERHFNDNIGLDDMALASNSSKFHLMRSFQKETGMTPGDYLAKVRIENAIKLVVFSGDLKLEEVASLCGFSSANYFGKVFKKHTGKTPADFRKSNNSYEINKVLYHSDKGE